MIVLTVLLVLGQAALGHGSTGLILLTPEEAKQLRLTESDWLYSGRTRGARTPVGPRIMVQTPPVKETNDGPTIDTITPADLVVLFEQNPLPVDMRSLQITARKGFFSKSLTALLTPFVQGTALRVQNVTIPEGDFLIEIAIADRNGSKTVETYRLHVRQP